MTGGLFLRYKEDIGKILQEDIREKRRAGSGSFHKRGKGVKHGISGALRTPYHFMSNKEKKKLNGEVEVYSMYETVIPLKELKLKDEELQRTMLIRWREIYSNDKIQGDLMCAKKEYYDLVNELKIPKKSRGGAIPRPKEAKPKPKKQAANPAISPQMTFEEIQAPPKEIEKQVVKQMLITQGLHVEFNGKYDVDTLTKLFTKLQLLVDGETNKYNISLSMSEITEE